MSQQSFNEKTTTKKGNIGEQILLRVIREFFPGANIFTPDEKDGPHQCDAVVISWRNKRIVLVEAKAKPLMTHFPESGFDVGAYQNYIDIGKRHRALVLVCFIDEFYGGVYGHFLQFLKRKRQIYWKGRNLQYPRRPQSRTGPVINFPSDYMRKLAKLTSDEIKQLKATSTRNTNYGPNNYAYERLGCELMENSWHPKQQKLFDET